MSEAASARDTVFIRDLEVRAIIGINDWERRECQTILIDLDMAWDTAAAAATEDIDKAVNYRSVAKAVMRHTEEGPLLPCRDGWPSGWPPSFGRSSTCRGCACACASPARCASAARWVSRSSGARVMREAMLEPASPRVPPLRRLQRRA